MVDLKLDSNGDLELSAAGDVIPTDSIAQAALRAEYVQAVRNNLRATLENTSIQEPDGTIHKLQKKGTP